MLETNFPPVLIFGQTGDSRQHSLPISGYRGRPPLVTCARQVDACAVRPLNRGPLRLPCDPSGIGALDRRHTPEITKVAPWPRLPEGTVTDHPHQCGAWAGPLYALPCRVCIRALPVCLGRLARTFARCVCRSAPGNEGQPGVPVPSDRWRPCTDQGCQCAGAFCGRIAEAIALVWGRRKGRYRKEWSPPPPPQERGPRRGGGCARKPGGASRGVPSAGRDDAAQSEGRRREDGRRREEGARLPLVQGVEEGCIAAAGLPAGRAVHTIGLPRAGRLGAGRDARTPRALQHSKMQRS